MYRLVDRTRSVLGGIPTQSVGTIIIVLLQEDLCITRSSVGTIASTLILPMLRVGMQPVTLRVTSRSAH